MDSKCRCTSQGNLGRRWHFANHAHVAYPRLILSSELHGEQPAASRDYCMARSPYKNKYCKNVADVPLKYEASEATVALT